MATSRVISALAASTAGTADRSAASVSSDTTPARTAAANSSASNGSADSTRSRASSAASSAAVLGGGLRTMPYGDTPTVCAQCGASVWNLQQHERWHRYADA